MALPVYVHFFAAVGIIVNLIIIFIVASNKAQLKSNLTYLLFTVIISIMIWILLTYLQLDLVSIEDNLILNSWFSAISNVLILIGLLAVLMFVSLLTRPQLKFRDTAVLLTLLSIVVGLKIAHLLSAYAGDVEMVELNILFTNLFNLIAIVIVVYSILKNLNLLRSENLSDKQKTQVNTLYLASIIGFVGIIPIQGISAFIRFEYLSFAYITNSVALILIAYAYLTDPRVAFILPEKTYLLLVISKEGVYKYSKDFKEESDREGSEILISGALNAIFSLMSEFYDTTVVPELIKFENQLILLKWSEDYFMAVFSERDSQLIRSAMNNLENSISRKYGDDLRRVIQDPQTLKIESLVEESFFFIYR